MSIKLGFVSALFAGTIGVLYAYVYYHYLFDYRSVLPLWKVFFGLTSFTLLMFYAQYFMIKWIKQHAKFWFALIFSLGSFISILYPIVDKVYVDAPEFYPGFVIPIHFLPILMIHTFSNLTNKS